MQPSDRPESPGRGIPALAWDDWDGDSWDGDNWDGDNWDDGDDLGFVGSGLHYDDDDGDEGDDEPRDAGDEPSSWYQSPTAIGALAAIGVAVIAIVVSAVLLVSHNSRDTTPEPVERTTVMPSPEPATSAPRTTPSASSPAPPPPPPETTAAPPPPEPPPPTARTNPSRQPRIDVTRTPMSVEPQPRRPPQY